MVVQGNHASEASLQLKLLTKMEKGELLVVTSSLGCVRWIASSSASRTRRTVPTCVCDKPSVSGKYSIAVSIFGVSLPGSPFALRSAVLQPDAEQCSVSGAALTIIVARTPHAFDIKFRDHMGLTTKAEELDVFVERLGEGHRQTSRLAAQRPHRKTLLRVRQLRRRLRKRVQRLMRVT